VKLPKLTCPDTGLAQPKTPLNITKKSEVLHKIHKQKTTLPTEQKTSLTGHHGTCQLAKTLYQTITVPTQLKPRAIRLHTTLRPSWAPVPIPKLDQTQGPLGHHNHPGYTKNTLTALGKGC